jgi:hypothetical protein
MEFDAEVVNRLKAARYDKKSCQSRQQKARGVSTENYGKHCRDDGSVMR